MNQLYINQIVIDKDNANCKIVNKTINSIEVYINKKTDKGINYTQWFTEKDFFDRFTI